LDFELIGDAIQVRQVKGAKPTRPQDGYGMLVSRKPGQRRLLDFDVAEAMPHAILE